MHAPPPQQRISIRGKAIDRQIERERDNRVGEGEGGGEEEGRRGPNWMERDERTDKRGTKRGGYHQEGDHTIRQFYS